MSSIADLRLTYQDVKYLRPFTLQHLSMQHNLSSIRTTVADTGLLHLINARECEMGHLKGEVPLIPKKNMLYMD